MNFASRDAPWTDWTPVQQMPPLDMDEDKVSIVAEPTEELVTVALARATLEAVQTARV